MTSPYPLSNDEDIQDDPTNGNDDDTCTRSTSGNVGPSKTRNHHPRHHHRNQHRPTRSSSTSSSVDSTGRTRTANTSSSSSRGQDSSTARGADNAAGVAGERNIPCGGSRGTIMNSGLLRVPCSIGICMDDHRQRHLPASHHQHKRHRRDRHHHACSPFEGPTSSLRAFVDTGAEVTVMSAKAAQRAGLLHLLDRRYAGRATGVGSCRVLGRLPAGCATSSWAEIVATRREGTERIPLPCPVLS